MTATETAPLPKLFGPAHAAHPEETYQQLRQAGPVARARLDDDVDALVVTRYRAAIDLLHDTDTYSKDPHLWVDLMEGRIPPHSPVLALMAPRPSLLYADGDTHRRLRLAMRECLKGFSHHELAEITRRHTTTLTERIAAQGHADIVADVALQVLPMIFAELMGCPRDIADRMVLAGIGMVSAGPEAADAAADLEACLNELIQIKSHTPGQDFTSWLLQHDSGLKEEEILHQLVVFQGAGSTPTAAWICNTLPLLLTGDQYAGRLSSGTIAIGRALKKTLWTTSPMATFDWHFARHSTVLHGVKIPPGVPIGISLAACNTDPDLPQLGYDSDAHLAWSAGPHECPADSLATVIAQNVLVGLLDQLQDLKLAPEAADIPNMNGPFYQCALKLPVTFRAHVRHDDQAVKER